MAAGRGQAAALTLPLRTPEDIVRMRQAVREQSMALGFSLVDQTKLVTAATELARGGDELGHNTIIYGGGGSVTLEAISEAARRGLRLSFADQGPGIPDIELALKDGYTSGSGLGLGLGGAKRLCNEFTIDSAPGRGTRVVVTRWR